MTPVVLKLGGSLAESGRLRAMLAIVRRARRSVVIVPGGGPFADAVRETQTLLRFSDEAAHQMALLAMHQMAEAMIAIEPRFVAAETLIGIERAWRMRRVPIWLPAKLCAGDRRIPRNWTITSDGLAARLAERLADVELVLVKSRTVRRTAAAKTLARQGVVDPVFPVIVERADLAWRVLGPGEEKTLSELLDVAPLRQAPRAPAMRRRGTRSTQRSARGRGIAGKVR
ncbi:uridylate kinase [Hyphomicrobium sp. LHD-15]|uniref:amino acid kinase family protein n=1 Tax=Hyphomicrobium sp. LHD-15 TaxID=3072142 RepID=UPI00280D2A31|nr:uridylate kinase [Hyphomicrobium sp. LHD-15]MDQ8697403.1 uridylate kinase [Hyphomicrobium sp. LHD-15]